MRKKFMKWNYFCFYFMFQSCKFTRELPYLCNSEERKLQSIKSYTECYGTHFKLKCIEIYDTSFGHLCRHKTINILVLLQRRQMCMSI